MRGTYGCTQCGYFGTQGCPTNSAVCPKGLYKPPRTPLDDLRDELSSRLPSNYSLILKPGLATNKLFIELAQRDHTEPYCVGYVEEGTHVDTMSKIIQAFIAGHEHGIADGREQIQSQMRLLINAAKDMGD